MAKRPAGGVDGGVIDDDDDDDNHFFDVLALVKAFSEFGRELGGKGRWDKETRARHMKDIISVANVAQEPFATIYLPKAFAYIGMTA